jgi:glutamine cyclotransferase
MKSYLNPLLSCIFLILFSVGIIIIPSSATSNEHLILQEGSQMDWADAHIDNNLVAVYVSSTKPPVIKVYHAEGRIVTEIPLSREVMKINALEISDGRVYYSEYNPEEPGYWRNETVYEYDLATGEKRTVYTTNGPQQKITKIAANGDNIVLRGGSNNQILILHTRSTGTSRQIFTSNSMIHGLAIDSDRILWGCERVDGEPGREIHVYTISTGEDYIIPESKSIRTFGYGDISGDSVVWVMTAKEPDSINGVPVTVESYDIRLMDLISGKSRSIEVSERAPMTDPHISKNIIAWVKKPEIDYNNSDTGTIRIYDIGTGTFSDLTSEVASISDFSNGMVLWQRLKPMSFWVTSISGNVPTTSSSITTTAIPDPQKTYTANTPAPESPAGAIIIVLAVMVGIVVHVTMKRKRGR